MKYWYILFFVVIMLFSFVIVSCTNGTGPDPTDGETVTSVSSEETMSVVQSETVDSLISSDGIKIWELKKTKDAGGESYSLEFYSDDGKKTVKMDGTSDLPRAEQSGGFWKYTTGDGKDARTVYVDREKGVLSKEYTDVLYEENGSVIYSEDGVTLNISEPFGEREYELCVFSHKYTEGIFPPFKSFDLSEPGYLTVKYCSGEKKIIAVDRFDLSKDEPYPVYMGYEFPKDMSEEEKQVCLEENAGRWFYTFETRKATAEEVIERFEFEYRNGLPVDGLINVIDDHGKIQVVQWNRIFALEKIEESLNLYYSSESYLFDPLRIKFPRLNYRGSGWFSLVTDNDPVDRSKTLSVKLTEEQADTLNECGRAAFCQKSPDFK